MDKRLSRKMQLISRNFSPPSAEKLKPVFDYLTDRLQARTEDPESQVVALLVWDRGRLRTNCYLNGVNPEDVWRELNMSTFQSVHYPDRAPSPETYHHGNFAPAVQTDENGTVISRLGSQSQKFPQKSYIALGRSIPVSGIDDLLVIPF